jgi:hypothetical protein
VKSAGLLSSAISADESELEQPTRLLDLCDLAAAHKFILRYGRM